MPDNLNMRQLSEIFIFNVLNLRIKIFILSIIVIAEKAYGYMIYTDNNHKQFPLIEYTVNLGTVSYLN